MSDAEKEDAETLQEIVRRQGRDFVISEISKLKNDANVLTIVSNVGLHPVPEDFVFGELYIASHGNLNFSTVSTVNLEINKVIQTLHAKLIEKNWSEIYLIPFGHSVLSMAIKLAVYRTLRIETNDIFYFGNGDYGVIRRDTRAALLKV